MNQGRIWCVVNPTVGLPLFLGSVAVTSLLVHASVLSNTAWFGNYWKGAQKTKTAAVEGTTQTVALDASSSPGVVISVAPIGGKSANGETSYVITVGAKPVAAASADSASVVTPNSLALAPSSSK
jgi:light-harvesting protein B-800-850 alpha chain